MQHTEPNPLLAEPAELSLATVKGRAIHELGTVVNHIVELIELLRALQGIKPPEPYADHYHPDDWVSMIHAGNYAGARQFILAHHI